MRDKLLPVWLVAQRELRDQVRDWRVVLPLSILTIFFPLLMNEFARATVDFLNRFSANLILDRLVPFSILIIGFFPITVSLVVALESFVGEKERGTIEPLLATPLENWQMYTAKLLVGIITPLTASLLSVGFYLILVRRQALTMPSGDVLAQLLALTAAHAVLMVSAAIVISVQSTSVKAANLLASFIVIPVAILMQGETVLIFWGNEEMLWLALGGVAILSALLIRVGLAHFQREYLLGREIDNLDVREAGRAFWKDVRGGAKSLRGWYAKVGLPAVGRLAGPFVLVSLIAVIGVWIGYDWSMQNIADVIQNADPDAVARLARQVRQSPDFINTVGGVSAPGLFMHNSQVVLGIFVAGLLSFSVLGLLVYLLNVGMIGGVFGLVQLLGLQPWPIFLAGVLPHGIFEVPAVMLASAAVLRTGVALVTPQSGESMGGVLVRLLADWTKIFFGFVLPLLAIAAAIETYITPGILLATINR